MAYAVMLTVGVIALVILVWLAFKSGEHEHWLLDYGSVGLMGGFIGVALLTYLVNPNPDAVVNLVWYYSPHAYNLILWPVLALIVLRPRFGHKFLGSFVLVYGLSEILWNSAAYIRFGGPRSPALAFMDAPYWQTFFTVVIVSVVVSYILVKPRIRPNLTWVFFAGFLYIYVAVAGIPTFLDSTYPVPVYVYVWELAWQGAIWVFTYGTFWEKNFVRLNWQIN